MDRDDARFVAGALASRISGDREALDRLHSTSFVRLAAAAVRLRSLAADWPPVHRAALELEAIAKYGGDAGEGPADPDLQIVVDNLLQLAAEPPIGRNRAERRAFAKKNLSRRDRLGVIRAGVAN